jgi:hypothetical protein
MTEEIFGKAVINNCSEPEVHLEKNRAKGICKGNL